MRTVELLAPAGDLNRCKTAIRFGADAVYIGGQSFSLRSRASNFTLADIEEACLFAKEYGSHIHVTVNMIPHEEDFEGLETYIKELERVGVTAVIVASAAIMNIVRKVAPSLEIHCSTQLSVTNAQTANFYHEELGINRVVLARECTLENVREITKASTIDTEAFIHGGMCVNYSGRCTLSNRMTLRDANRGGCAQSCRWEYRLFEKKKEITTSKTYFTMGSRDLCAAQELEQLIHAGVTSFKIEGRMKTEYYVASVVSAYRHLIDRILEGTPLTEEECNFYQKEILKGENRAVCNGLYTNERGDNSLILHMNSDQEVNHDFIGKVEIYDPDTKSFFFRCRNVVKVGDTLEILSPKKENRNFVVEWIQDEDKNYLEECKNPMRFIEMPVPFEMEPGDIIRRISK
ncbi:MAG: U32 family peptidase [Solobacterium sp.]|nr:U32 family peptidase [Solobacterium sp.]